MKILKKILLALGLLLSFCIFLLLSLIFIVFHYPKSSYNFAAEHLFPKDLKITWQDMQFSSQHLDGWSYAIDWEIHDLRITKQNPLLDAPIDTVHLRAQVNAFSSPHIRLQSLALTANDKISFLPNKSNNAEKPQSPFATLQTYLDSVRQINEQGQIQELTLQVSDFYLASHEGPGLHFSFNAQQEKNKPALHFNFKMQNESKNILSLDGNLFWLALGSDKPLLNAELKYQQNGVSLTQSFTLAAQNEKAHLKSSGPIHYKKDKMHLILDPEIDFLLQPENVHLQVKTNLRGIPGPLVHIDRLNIDIDTPFEEDHFWSTKNSDFHLSAPLDVFFVDRSSRRILEKNCHCEIPETLITNLEGQVNFSNLLSESKEEAFLAKMQLKVETMSNKLFSLHLAAALEVRKKSGEYIYTPNLDSSLTVHSFQGMKNILLANHILVPAPLDVLDGSLHFESKGSSHIDKTTTNFPLLLNVDLSSTKQKVKIQTDGNIQLANNLKQADVNLAINLQDVQIELPPLDPLKGIPRITSDPRILKKPTPPADSKASSFRLMFAFTLKTAAPGSVKLYYKYFQPYLPLTLQLENNGVDKVTGFVQTEPFVISYLRRKVQVAKLKIDLSSMEEDSTPVNAKFIVKQTDYTIFIDVAGDIQNPNIVLSSEPYLSSSEIISVLLYDRTSDQLLAVDAETAGGVQSAMADRAIGLFGLWAFASTPIRSFSYNPVTKVYSASVSVTDDVSANIGTNWEQATHLELRKRVSRKWVLTAAWTPATQDAKQQSKLVLQWEKRF